MCGATNVLNVFSRRCLLIDSINITKLCVRVILSSNTCFNVLYIFNVLLFLNTRNHRVLVHFLILLTSVMVITVAFFRGGPLIGGGKLM
jgi:hypothetical protein